jgi:hypothetical protein
VPTPPPAGDKKVTETPAPATEQPKTLPPAGGGTREVR